MGRSGFIDEVWDYFTTIGADARIFVTPRLAIGPEVAYLTGEFDRLEASNLTVTGNITSDLVQDDGVRRVVPYLVAGGGYLRQKTLVGGGPGSTELVPFTSGEGTVSGGLGVRIALSSRVFIAPEFRLGWEPESRIAVTIGISAPLMVDCWQRPQKTGGVHARRRAAPGSTVARWLPHTRELFVRNARSCVDSVAGHSAPTGRRPVPPVRVARPPPASRPEPGATRQSDPRC